MQGPTYILPPVRTCLWEFGQLHPKIDNQSLRWLPTAPRGHVRLPLSRSSVTKNQGQECENQVNLQHKMPYSHPIPHVHTFTWRNLENRCIMSVGRGS